MKSYHYEDFFDVNQCRKLYDMGLVQHYLFSWVFVEERNYWVLLDEFTIEQVFSFKVEKVGAYLIEDIQLLTGFENYKSEPLLLSQIYWDIVQRGQGPVNDIYKTLLFKQPENKWMLTL